MDMMQEIGRLKRAVASLARQVVTAVTLSSDNVSNPPTTGDLNTAFGNITTSKTNGFVGVVDDSGAGTHVYLVAAVNGAWQAVRMGNAPTQFGVAFHAEGDGGVTLTDQASAAQFFANSNRNITKADLSLYTQCRLIARVTTGSASANTPRLILRYRNGSFSTTVGDYSDIGTSEVDCPLVSTGVIDSGWIDLAAGAKNDVLLTVVQIGGDGAADPAVANLQAHFRRA